MKSEREFAKKHTSDLISILQNGTENEDSRKLAFVVLCTRFRKELLEKCEIICNRFGHDVVVAEIIANRTFKKYAMKPEFQHEKSNTKNVNTGFLLYLYGIAKRELTNYYREEKKKQAGYSETDKIIVDLPDIPIEMLNLETRVKNKAICTLSSKHRAVYLTYEYFERRGLNPPQKIKKELREYLGIKQTTVRGYKIEANKIIDAYMDSMNIIQNNSNETR